MTSERNKSVQVRTAAYQMVRRLRTELNIMLSARGFRSVAQLRCCGGFRRNRLFVDAEHVAGAAFGVQRRAPFSPPHFTPQTIFLTLHPVGASIQVLLPN